VAGIVQAIPVIAREEGVRALWKGITPRLMRIMPGQAITFMTYEWVSKHMSGIEKFFGQGGSTQALR
jgi:solute carrier family 25 (mitochondrial citrate transporter), member 1